jgi:serine/threonine protein kinase
MAKKIQSYEIIATVGSGGMGVVYKAKHVLQNKVYALKALYPQYCSDPVILKRFENEALILSKLSHPNILQVYDFIEYEHGYYIVMEFVEGKPLSKIIGTETGPLHFDKALPLFNQILSGMQHAHEEGVIHRDLKPGNILVTPDGTVKISDFGIAKVDSEAKLTGTGTHIGTLYYMSPEQIRGEAATKQSDIYSLGVTLYEMLAGRTPFQSDPDTPEFRIMEQIVYQPLPDPRTIYPYIPEPLVSLVLAATQKEPAARLQSVEAFQSAIAAFRVANSKPGSAPKLIAEPVREKEPGAPATAIMDAEPEAEGKQSSFGKSTFILVGALLLILFAILLFSKYDVFSRKGPPNIPGDTPYSFAAREDMAWVEAGQFMMGSNYFDDEQPIHAVQLDTFFIDKAEVTVAQYRTFCTATGRQMPQAPPWGWIDNNPIVNVSWDDASAYAAWAGKRLPTEAEWEYAARGGRRGAGGKYSGSNSIDDVAWYADNANFTTHPVKLKKANELGLYDMSGNVWEWCRDGYQPRYDDRISPAVNPIDPTTHERVIRGGAWFYDETSARVTNRRGVEPKFKSPMIGFRCVISRSHQ